MSEPCNAEKPGKVAFDPTPPDWLKPNAKCAPGRWSYSAKPKALQTLGLANPRDWSPDQEDWKLPDNWKEIILQGLKERLDRYRSLRLFMDACVRCGACADKCHFFIGTGDPKNMPVLRAELLRSVYRRDDAGRTAAWTAGRRTPADARSAQGVVLLFLSVHGVPPLLGLLSFRH
jgi:ferredoxin